MKIAQPLLAAAMRRLTRAVVANKLPVLTHILVRQDSLGLHLCATDLEIYYAATLPSPPPVGLLAQRLAALRKPVEFLLPAEVLKQCASSADKDSDLDLTPEAITFQLGGQLTSVPCSNSYETTEFPPPPTTAAATGFVPLDSDPIARAVRCASQDEARYILQGIFWEGERLIATDGRRLHAETDQAACPHPEGFIIPIATAKLLDTPCEARITSNPGTAYIDIRFRTDGLHFSLLSKTIEGNFPNYRQVIPADISGDSVRFDNKEAARNLRKLFALRAGRKGEFTTALLEAIPHAVRFSIQHSADTLGSFTLPAIHTGSPDQIKFNLRFLIDALENGGDTIAFRDSISPAFITGIRKNFHVLMPMRTDSPAPQPADEEPETEPEEIEA